jgi:hypothetical protein
VVAAATGTATTGSRGLLLSLLHRRHLQRT